MQTELGQFTIFYSELSGLLVIILIALNTKPTIEVSGDLIDFYCFVGAAFILKIDDGGVFWIMLGLVFKY